MEGRRNRGEGKELQKIKEKRYKATVQQRQKIIKRYGEGRIQRRTAGVTRKELQR